MFQGGLKDKNSREILIFDEKAGTGSSSI